MLPNVIWLELSFNFNQILLLSSRHNSCYKIITRNCHDGGKGDFNSSADLTRTLTLLGKSSLTWLGHKISIGWLTYLREAKNHKRWTKGQGNFQTLLNHHWLFSSKKLIEGCKALEDIFLVLLQFFCLQSWCLQQFLSQVSASRLVPLLK